MKITISDTDISPEEIDEIKENKDLIKEASPEEFKKVMLRTKHIELSPQVVEFAAKELGMTPDEFIAMLLKQAGASQ